MKNRFVLGYGIVALIILVCAVLWFSYSIALEIRKGSEEAERSFSWISRTTELSALTDGFMSEAFVQRLTLICRQSRSLAALSLTGPAGMVYSWPQSSPYLVSNEFGDPAVRDTSLFMRAFSSSIEVSDGSGSPVVMTAVVYVLHPTTIFAASRITFLVTLALVLVTFIVIIVVTPAHQESQDTSTIHFTPFTLEDDDTAVSFDNFSPDYAYEQKDEEAAISDSLIPEETSDNQEIVQAHQEKDDSPTDSSCLSSPEGLFPPITGIGWEQYLKERLDAELVRAASSEQDLALLIMRVSGMVRTDLVSRKIAQILLETFKFRDMIFEYGCDGFAGIMQNVNLDQAMKIADGLYADIDSLLMEMGFEGEITVGITTRTARLIPAGRMIEEAVSAARKAVEEPNLPIVAFRANPEKYRSYVAEKI